MDPRGKSRSTRDAESARKMSGCYDVHTPSFVRLSMTISDDVHATVHRIARAAEAFLCGLGPEEGARATFPFDSDERENWHYVPRPRAGLPRGDMTPSQARAAEDLMAAGLSAVGLGKARSIMRHEAILRELEASNGTLRFDRLEGLYYFSVFGAPESTEPWGWRVDGHHLSLNMTVIHGEGISVTPSFFGANPAEVRHGPDKGLRILREEEDSARSLVRSLNTEQLHQCTIYPTAPPDLITRASRRVELGEPVGLPADMMTANQRERLLRLIEVYVGRKSADVAAEQIRKIHSAGLSSVRFGWAGSHHRGRGHYYRVHGPTFLIEYDNTQNSANHIHSVWRDIDGDFGRDLLQEHYRRAH